MDKPAVTEQKTSLPDCLNIQEKKLPEPKTANTKRPILKNPRILKAILTLFVVLSIFTSVYLSVIYYKRNFTPNAILAKSLHNLIEDENVKYDGVIKVIFSYAQGEEKINISDLEIYSLLKKSASDSHEIVILGEHGWTNGLSQGKYSLVWSVSGKKAFAFEGYYQGYDFYYKVNSYLYSDMVGDELKNDYSKVNTGELLTKVLSDKERKMIEGVRFEDFRFEATQAFQNDLIDGNDSYHYKVKVSGVNEAEVLLKNFNYDDFDVWIDKKSREIRKIAGKISFVNIGIEGNNMEIQFDFKISN